MGSPSRIVEPSPARLPDFAAQLQRWQARVESELSARLPAADTQPTRLHEAIRYSVLGGGKRVRPALVYATGAALGIDASDIDGAACAVELIHAYSLVHDDLPAMDDDDLRRGQPTCHKRFDEATAILAGDALQALAFEVHRGFGDRFGGGGGFAGHDRVRRGKTLTARGRERGKSCTR